MKKQMVMGNQAIALGAIYAGVNLVAGYPGTPSTEILETVAKNNPGDIYVEWSVNEKAALEVAAGASYSGARTLVTMKQVGLNVASDPLMSLNYVGIKGGMVIAVADDPGPISSQTEQDTRCFAEFAKMMVFDPSSPSEAYQMVQDAYLYSEKYQVPVFLRPTTRVCHGYQSIEIDEKRNLHEVDGFVKDTSRWVIFPRLSYENHIKLEEKMVQIADEFSDYAGNLVTGNGKKGIVCGGVSYEYVREVLGDREDIRLLKIGTPNPFPEKLVISFLQNLEEVIVFEELDPVIERHLYMLCGKNHLAVNIVGKLTHHVKNAGENTVASVSESLAHFMNDDSLAVKQGEWLGEEPKLPVRPPVLCAGCPHRASFYAVKCAMQGQKANFAGDIGCYTLGNAKPLDMVDTCLCMGADITIAQGLKRMNQDTVNFAFIGDSTFFASGMTGVVNAVYNETDITIIVLDNSTTAMTGHQPHPGTGVTMMGEISQKVSIEKILVAIGLKLVETVDPLDFSKAVQTVKRVSKEPGVKAVIFKSPCIAVTKPEKPLKINTEKCIQCKKCVRELGCPAIDLKEGQVHIEPSLCFGCNLCSFVCPVGAIER